MSITSDLRGYADTAVNQGKQFVEQAQAQLNEVSGSVNEFAGGLRGKLAGAAKDNVNGLRAFGDSAEKALNLQALRAAVEPYLEQAKGYTTQISGRAEDLVTKALDMGKADPRVAKLLEAAESVAGSVVDTLQTKVIKPLQHLRGVSTQRPQARRATKPATTKPVTPAPASAPAAKPATAKAAKPAAKAPRKSAPRTSTQA